MKNHSQMARFGFALSGLKSAWLQEASFRTEIVIGGIVLLAMAWERAPWSCWVAAIIALAFALTMELINTAIENVCDALHPNEHPMIKIAKDCASAGVLIANGTGLFVVALLLWLGRR